MIQKIVYAFEYPAAVLNLWPTESVLPFRNPFYDLSEVQKKIPPLDTPPVPRARANRVNIKGSRVAVTKKSAYFVGTSFAYLPVFRSPRRSTRIRFPCSPSNNLREEERDGGHRMTRGVKNARTTENRSV